MPAATSLRVGEKVICPLPKHRGKVFTVVKIMTKNIRVQDEDGNFFKGPPSVFVKKYDPTRPVPAPTVAQSIKFVPGEVVRWKGDKPRTYVVCRHSRETVTIALLFGEEGKVRRVDPSSLTRLKQKVRGGESASEEPLGFVAEVKQKPKTNADFIPADFSQLFADLMEQKFPTYEFIVTRGRKYDRIFYNKVDGGQKFIHCFIGRETHSLFKAETLAKPAVGARFNLRDRRDIERVVALADIHGSYLYVR